jgi:hypothetical protein
MSIMVARTTQTAVKPSSTKRLNGAAPHVADKDQIVHGAKPSTFEQAQARFHQAQDEFMAFLGAPGWKRTLVAVISGLAIVAGCGWAIGNIVSFLMVGALLATGSVFLTMALGLVAAIVLSIKAGKFAARVFGAVLTGEADERALAAYDATRAFAAKLNPLRLFANKDAVAA